MIDHAVSKDLFKGTGITQIVSGFQGGVIPEWIQPQKGQFLFYNFNFVGLPPSLQKCITLPCYYFRISQLSRDIFCVLIDKSEHTGVYFLTACVNRTAILWDDAVKPGTNVSTFQRNLP